jgi:hypothetical protein
LDIQPNTTSESKKVDFLKVAEELNIYSYSSYWRMGGLDFRYLRNPIGHDVSDDPGTRKPSKPDFLA